MSYTNADGLRVLTFGAQGVVAPSGQTAVSPEQVLVQKITLTALGTTFGASNIDPYAPFIPAGSVITGADLVITAAATSGGSATLTIGTYNAAGTAIDADGIDATVALTAIDATGDVVRCDGAQAAGVLGYVSANAYIGALYATAAYTAGEATLIVRYVKIA
jgi:hypothetical protein